MAYKATGRPVGRPKTKDYKTISLKMPQELLDRVQTYAGQHRQTISELIRDGLEWRITEGDPRWPSMPDKRYSGNTELDELAQPVHLVDEHIPFDEDGRHAPEGPVPPVPERAPDGNTVLPTEAESDHDATPTQTQYGNTVLQRKASQPQGRHKRGRPDTMRQRILTLLSAHSEGLSAEELRAYLKPEKPIGDVLQGMRTSGVVTTRGKGKAMRYFVA
jgi:hypothetical protein